MNLIITIAYLLKNSGLTNSQKSEFLVFLSLAKPVQLKIIIEALKETPSFGKTLYQNYLMKKEAYEKEGSFSWNNILEKERLFLLHSCHPER